MTPVPEHDHTTQEQTLWDLMEAGDWDEIETMRDDAYDSDPKPPSTPPPPGWKPPVAQYNIDHKNAHHHYQDSHEPPEEEREANTAAAVELENEPE